MFFLLIETLLLISIFAYRLLAHEWHPMLIGAFAAALFFVLFQRQAVTEDWRFFRARPKEWWWRLWKDWGEPLVVAAILALVIRTFLLGPYKIPTGSMIPTFQIGDQIFVDKVTYRFKDPERGDVIVFKYPGDPKKDFVKRLVGLPEEKVLIRDGKLLIDGKVVEEPPISEQYYYNSGNLGESGKIVRIPANHYFVLGDNSAHSSDSRFWGFVPRQNVVGKAFVIWWPPHRIKFVE